MVRIEGVDLPRDKRVVIALTYIFGVGRSQAGLILDEARISHDTKVRDLTEDEVARIRSYITKKLVTEGDLRRKVALSIKRLIDIGCYRGIRHRRNLPVRGQSSKTNARTRKGPIKSKSSRGF
ncbi:MAG: hypothetical protein RLZ12_342 [Bacillota bacterium]|jgi:small subunit ribosomal protein S13